VQKLDQFHPSLSPVMASVASMIFHGWVATNFPQKKKNFSLETITIWLMVDHLVDLFTLSLTILMRRAVCRCSQPTLVTGFTKF
jgi:hypothetical protein